MAFPSPTAVSAAPALSQREFEKFSRLAYEHFGLDLPGSKQGLVAARLGKKLRELGLKSFQHYYDYVQADRTGAALEGMVDYLTTNHTSFFREPKHFEFLREVIFPALRSRPRIDIWSAACSTGEEPYSIAMALLEESPYEASVKLRIKATDISNRALEKARCGLYADDRCQAIPQAMRQRYMVRSGPDGFRFRKEVQSLVEFERLNLMACLPAGYRCQVIFCRNIMIYFDRPTQQDLVERLSAHLDDGGYFLIGHSESLNSIRHTLEYLSPATYRKPGPMRGSQIGRG